MISFDKIVKKLLKKRWNILLLEDIFDILDPDKQEKNKKALYKIMYRLKSEKVILTLRNSIYLIPDEDDLKLNEIDLVEKYYFKLVKKYITSEVWSEYFISWKKALEINLKDFSVPNNLVVITRNTEKKVKIQDKIITFKKVGNKNANLYSKFSKFINRVSIFWTEFKISNIELSLVETALVSDNIEWVEISLLSKAIKKYSRVFKTDTFYEIAKVKYIMSFNRLKEISKNIDKKTYELFLDVIKQNWWLFIWEWLRKI